MNIHSYVPLYLKLFNFYKEKILKQDYLPGDQVDSINRIMERHGVSRDTAKLVLLKLSEEGYIVKKVGKGSYVTYTDTLKKIWGIVIPFYSSNIKELIGNLNQKAKDNARQIVFFLHYNDPEEEMRQVGSMIRLGYEAVIVIPNYDESLTAEFYRNLNSGSSKVILIDRTMAGSFFDYVIQSYDLGVKRAFNHLISMNDKNLLFVKNDDWVGRNLVNEFMEQTLSLFVSQQTPDRELFIISNLFKLNESFLRKNNIGGILCSTDIDSVRITGRLVNWKIKMPDEVSVVSYGNTELTQVFDPPITAVECHYGEMAELTSSIITSNITMNSKYQHVIQPDLVVRST